MKFEYEIETHLGILSSDEGGKYTKEVNIISYNRARPKLDIREWIRSKPGEQSKDDILKRGITLNWEEVQKLLELLQDLTGADFR